MKMLLRFTHRTTFDSATAKNTAWLQMDSLIRFMGSLGYGFLAESGSFYTSIPELKSKGLQTLSFQTAVDLHNEPKSLWLETGRGSGTLAPSHPKLKGLELTPYGFQLSQATKIVKRVFLTRTRKSKQANFVIFCYKHEVKFCQENFSREFLSTAFPVFRNGLASFL
ncbi:hypothetical protein [Pseudomonas phage PH826]|uniref:DUF7390 domain-containing protein n=1 Tax=Pseudomonas aeruginosa TaxID=287 RepID=UPI001CBFCAA5|nr:hypothetical protein [Pseudomonas aeruginosa]UVD32738.1 hypothetical protein [Pseudomonas phage PH826]